MPTLAKELERIPAIAAWSRGEFASAGQSDTSLREVTHDEKRCARVSFKIPRGFPHENSVPVFFVTKIKGNERGEVCKRFFDRCIYLIHKWLSGSTRYDTLTVIEF